MDVEVVSSDTASLSQDEDESEDITIGSNCPEKIVFIIDINTEMGRTYFQPSHEKSCSNLDWVKKGVEMFLRIKSMLNSKHEYAVVLLQDNKPFYLQELTTDVGVVNASLRDVVVSDTKDDDTDEICLDALMELLNTQKFREMTSNSKYSPNSTIRAVFVYCRDTDCKIGFVKNEKVWDTLHEQPCFFFDTISICESPHDRNCSRFREWDINVKNYNFSVCRNGAQIFETFAKMIAHPLQRERHDRARYRILLDT